MKKRPQILSLLIASFCAASASAQTGARDMYFGGLEAAGPAAASRSKLPPAVKRPVVQRAQRKANANPALEQPPFAHRREDPALHTGNRAEPPGVPVINAARTPLGLRYSILKMKGADGVEVPVSTRFQSGDRIQLQIQANADGYLYIVSQGSSGAWQVMFPTQSRNQGSNRIRAGEDHSSIFRFDAKPGVERIFVVLSRVPERDLDSVIYNLKGATSDQAPAPASPRPAPQAPLMLAGNLTVTDPLVSRLRTSYTRDLVLEEVAAAEQPERAVYVVNKVSGPDARVVADIRLTHQ